MKYIKHVLALLMVTVLVVGLVPVMSQVEAKGKKVQLSNTKLTLTVGNVKTVKLKNNNKTVKWSTSNKKVVKITKKAKGYVKIKALKAGSAKVTAKAGGKKYTCKITVKAKRDTSTESTTEAPTTEGTTTEASTTEDKKDDTTGVVQGKIIHSGTDGGAKWAIDENGLLLIEMDGDYEGHTTSDGRRNAPEWVKDDFRKLYKSAVVIGKNETCTDYMFREAENLTSVDLSRLDTSQVQV